MTGRPARPPARAGTVVEPDKLYFSIPPRKALTPNDLASLDGLAERVLTFGEHYRQVARPPVDLHAQRPPRNSWPASIITSPCSRSPPNYQNLRTAVELAQRCFAR